MRGGEGRRKTGRLRREGDDRRWKVEGRLKRSGAATQLERRRQPSPECRERKGKCVRVRCDKLQEGTANRTVLLIVVKTQDHPLARYCPLWHTRPHGFVSDDKDDSRSPPHSLVKTRHARKRYLHPYKACFVLLPN
ncbi:hypothetical protein PIB30_103926 [Stylosanthes scabra]|uniref:Uncharacterized protein n=1 Tax=Stylosanthes scabra TaxID=79078 RepID=A0ABU6YVX1_9FABA|nr:hypothetical protein [Stylosanthes scabra]